jgi:superfamily II DNA/RNA helicase
MHSDLDQKERDEVMLDFRNGKVDILIATDIVARGIDVDDIPLVINYDVPRDAEDYVHRIGRTARGGSGLSDEETGPQSKSGEAVTLVSEKDQVFFNRIERFLGKPIERMNIHTETINTLENDHPTNTRSASHRVPRKRKNHSSKPHTSEQTGDQVRRHRKRPGRGKH